MCDSQSIKNQIKVISDIHLEYYTDYNFFSIIEPDSTSILCLLGDIGNPFSDLYKKFIEWCSKNFYRVFIIAGNHEYYNSSIEKSNSKITDVCSFYNTHFLNNSSFIINDKIFIGTTLWSFIPDKYKDTIQTSINDYKYIENFNYETCNKLHIESINYIKSIIEKFKYTHRIIILSHHSPLLENTSKSHLEKLDTNYAFSSDQTELMKDVEFWLYGHTHFNNINNQLKYNNTTLISNQVGYSKEYLRNYNKFFYFI